MRKTKPAIIEAVHETAKGLRAAGVMNQDLLEAMLVEGLQGEETPLIRDDWTAIRKEALAQFKARRKRN